MSQFERMDQWGVCVGRKGGGRGGEGGCVVGGVKIGSILPTRLKKGRLQAKLHARNTSGTQRHCHTMGYRTAEWSFLIRPCELRENPPKRGGKKWQQRYASLGAMRS